MLKISIREGTAALLTPIIAVFFVLSLVILPNHQNAAAGVPTCTWTGAGINRNWSTAGNWTCDSGTIPVTGDALILNLKSTDATAAMNNDLATTLNLSGLQINVTASVDNQGFDIIGNAFNLSGNISVSNLSTFSNPNVKMDLSATLQTNVIVALDGTSKPVSFVWGLMGHTNTILLGSHNLIITTGQAVDTSQFASNFTSSAIIGGTGNITALASNANKLGTITLTQLDSSFSGNLDMTNEAFQFSPSQYGLGNATGTTILKGNSSISVLESAQSSPATIAENILIDQSAATAGFGWSFYDNGDFSNTGSFSEVFRKYYRPNATLTFSGTVTLVAVNNFNFNISRDIQITGPIVGSYPLRVYDGGSPNGGAGRLIIASSSNGSTTPNGTYRAALSAFTLADAQATNTLYIGALAQVFINGTRGAITLTNTGILSGSGTVGALTSTTGEVSPGTNAPAILNTGNLSLDSTSSYDQQIGGTTAGTGYDQLNVTGTASLGNAILNISTYNSYTPVISNVYTIINNDGTDAITGTFNAMAEGSRTTIGGYTYKISYIGGTGNDVTLTVTGTPGAPDTSGVLAKPVNIVIAIGVISAGVAVIVVRTKYLKSTRKVAVRSRK